MVSLDNGGVLCAYVKQIKKKKEFSEGKKEFFCSNFACVPYSWILNKRFLLFIQRLDVNKEKKKKNLP